MTQPSSLPISRVSKRFFSTPLKPMLGLSLLVGLSSVHAATIASQWKFNDPANGATSVSNSGVVGTIVGVAARTGNGGGVSGVPGDYGLDIGGTTGAMTANAPATITALNGITAGQAMSISYWQFLDTTPGTTAFWSTSASSVGSRGLSAHSPWSDGNTYFDTSGCCTPGPQRISGALGATLGVWQHIAFTYNAGTKTIYRNTTVIATGATGDPLKTDLSNFIIGNDGAMLTQGMDAKIDNFTVWIGALTTQEIAALSVRPVPEPTAALLGMIGLLGASMRRRR